MIDEFKQKETRKFKNCGAQGDIKIIRVIGDKIPANFKKVDDSDGKIVVTHSESGHHHVMLSDQCDVYEEPQNKNVKYFVVKAESGADIIHLKHGPDQHAPVNFSGIGAVYKIVRQRETTPEGLTKIRED